MFTKYNCRSFDNTLLINSLIKQDDYSEFNINVDDLIQEPVLNTLSAISLLYIYTSVPPHAHGTQAPKVIETVSRAYSFNKKRNSNKSLLLNDKYHVERMDWSDDDGDFPINETHGNFSVGDVHAMSYLFLRRYSEKIIHHANDLYSKILKTNSDVLTQGKQTLCSILDQSVPAPLAYQEMKHLFDENGFSNSYTMLEWVHQFFMLYDKTSLTTKRKVKTMSSKIKYNKRLKLYQTSFHERISIKKITYNREQVSSKMLDYARSFASYLKHKERKREKRAIASANMIMRMFLKIVEDFHLVLGKDIEGSTISVGGEEKKAKIISNLGACAVNFGGEQYRLQGTEDATKWNECLSPAAFMIMHKTFFDPNVRKQLGLPLPTLGEKIIGRIYEICHFLMCVKRVQVGNGPICENEVYYNRPKLREENINRFNEQTKSCLTPILKYIDEDDYIQSSPGMLMGMLNAASTTLGLIACNYQFDNRHMQLSTMRSSDDSMTVYCGSSEFDVNRCILRNYINLALIGINLSKDKTMFFMENYGEYNSWYQDKKFVSQYGIEVSSLRPQGKNPQDDLYFVAKSTAVNLQTYSLNILGAAVKLILGIANVRRLWRIEYNPSKRMKDKIKEEVLLISDGGKNMWNIANCHLEETSLKEHYATTIQEREYMLKIRNPENPFSGELEENLYFSKDTGALAIDTIENPRTVFTFIKRSNRTVMNSKKPKSIFKEKNNMEALKISRSIDPTLYLRYPNSNMKLVDHLKFLMDLQREGLNLKNEEQAMYEKAINILTSDLNESEDEEENFDLTELPE